MKIQIIERMRNERTSKWTFGEFLLAVLLSLCMVCGIVITIPLALAFDQPLAATFVTVAWIICAAALMYIFSGERHQL